MNTFMYGALTAGFFIAAAFFLKFWRRANDGLLLIFACAFFVLALSYALLGLGDFANENRGPLYLLRLLAFVLIIGGVVWKNRRRT